MKTFLSELALQIVGNKEYSLEKTVIILPNKRAGKQLLSHIATHFQNPIIAPKIFSINEFITSLSKLIVIENQELIMRLFNVYKSSNSSSQESFSTFMTWAPLFLSDCDNIDRHLVKATDIFTNIAEIKELETSLQNEILTKSQQKYIDFYKNLATLYRDFTEHLKSNKVAYEGMIYRDASELLQFLPTLCDEYRYIFVGFNALTPSELEILKYYYTFQNAELYFDIDAFYQQNYGDYITEIQQKLRIKEIPKSNLFKDITKNIEIVSAPKRAGQILQAVDILNNIELKQGNLENTVLVLGDESLLIPLIHFYDYSKANISLEYPVKATFSHQYLMKLVDNEKNNNRMQKPKFLLATQGFEFLQFLITEMKPFANSEISEDEKIIATKIIEILSETEIFIKRFFCESNILDFAIVEFFLIEKCNSSGIPFLGNFGKGLQIMGVLETRTLDFKNVIVLSSNEGVLPKGNSTPSLLLWDIKRHFGLPLQEQNEKIFGYHFFRLMQRAENIFLIYDNDSTNSLAEKSRFLEQLQFEVKNQKLEKSVNIKEKHFSVSFPESVGEKLISIPKTEKILQELKDFHYSATSLSTYINCPLQFYWRYIEKITIPKEEENENENLYVGNAMHQILEDLFIEIKEKPSDSLLILETYKNDIDKKISYIFEYKLGAKPVDFSHGKLLIAFSVVKEGILAYLKLVAAECQANTFEIISLEDKLKCVFTINGNDIKLKGKADRIEKRDGILTILDYKTGRVDETKLKFLLDMLREKLESSEHSQLFQLLFYGFLFRKQNHYSFEDCTNLQCGIVAFQELYMQKKCIKFAYEGEKKEVTSLLSNDVFQEFEEFLSALLNRLLDKAIPISQIGNEDNCCYCEYCHICERRNKKEY